MNQQEQNAAKQQVRTNIKKIADTFNKDAVEIINCTVISVDKAKRICVVKPLSGKSNTQIEDVGLMPERNDGEFKIPAVGSTVGIVQSTLVDPYIISWSDLDEWYLVIGTTKIDVKNGTIKLGDGSYGGMIKINSLITQMNKSENKINLILAFLASLGATPPLTTPLTPTVLLNIENNSITHGLT